MQRPIRNYFSALLFLVAFLLPRVADLHAFDHIADDNVPVSCEQCDITANSHQFDVYLEDATPADINVSFVPSTAIVFTSYNSPLAKIVSPTTVYNKPPPQLPVG